MKWSSFFLPIAYLLNLVADLLSPEYLIISTLPRVTSSSFSSSTQPDKALINIHVPVKLSRIPASSNKSHWSVLIRVVKVLSSIWSLSNFSYVWPIRLSVTLLIKFKTLKSPLGGIVCSVLKLYTDNQAYILAFNLLFSELSNFPLPGHPTPTQTSSKLYQVFGCKF